MIMSLRDIVGNVIATHHGGLFDNISNDERTLSVKTNKSEDKLHYAEAVNAFCAQYQRSSAKKRNFKLLSNKPNEKR